MYFVKASAIWTDGIHFTVHTLNVIKKLNAVEKKASHTHSANKVCKDMAAQSICGSCQSN